MITFSGLCDVNKNPIAIDETKPIIFLDIDGVINALPYEREWIGPEFPLPGGLWDLAYTDPKNWQWNELSPDLALQYPVSRQIKVELDRWLDQPQSYIDDYLMKEMPEKRYRKLQINLMDEMLDEMREIIEAHGMQIVYLTFWRSEALRILEPILNLGGVSFLDWNTHSDRGHRLKIDALQYLYEKADIRTPFVIFDDESTAGLTAPNTPLWYFDTRYAEKYPDKATQIMELNSIPKLIVQTDARWGIERAHIDALRDFAIANAP